MEGFSEEAIQNELRKLKLDQEFKKEAELLDAQYLLMQNSLAQYNLEQAKGVILTDAQKQEAQKLIDKLDELKKKREELEGNRDKAKTEGDAAVKGAEETPKDKIEGRIGQLKKDLKDLTNLGNIVTGTAEAIGSAFSKSFQGVITGSMTAKEALNNFFQSIANYFLDMATKIIAKWIEMIILNSVLQLFGAAAGAAAGSAGGNFSSAGAGDTGYSWGDALKFKRAGGGPVVAGTPYMVGEKGPELFVPGNTGSIISNTRTEALMASRGALRGGSGSSSSAFADNRESLNNVSSINRERMVERVLTSGAGSTEIRYNRVGSGDLPFVTEADMLQATRVAAQEGARMCQQRTIAALKSNPGARRSIGI
jgi:hypothetical protein